MRRRCEAGGNDDWRAPMSMFDKAKDLLSEHADKVDDGIDKLGDLIDDKTGGEHADKVDVAQEKLKEQLDQLDDQA
jgi:hypothetical protein